MVLLGRPHLVSPGLVIQSSQGSSQVSLELALMTALLSFGALLSSHPPALCIF